MSYFAEIDQRVTALRDLLGDLEDAAQLPAAAAALDDREAVAVMSLGADLAKRANQMCAVGAAVIARRSHRDAGVDGIAQSLGHRSPESLVQVMTGASRADAAKQIRVGESLLDAEGAEDDSADPEAAGGGASTESSTEESSERSAEEATAPARPWHACLSRAVLAAAITTAQHDAIRRGLGEPPQREFAADTRSFAEAWAIAAEQLAAEAAERTVEELTRSARTIRDRLDPEGARARFDARYEARSFRTYTDADGVHHGHLIFDDEGFAWVRAIGDAALRPRRGGPRFVDAEERSNAASLASDPRTNDQLGYDLIIDVLRAGALADAKTVFGTRQAGIRIVHVEDRGPVPFLEDDGSTLPEWLLATRSCDGATLHVSIDDAGNPLDVGREHRLFTPKQRIALAIRDGGCRWRGCDRPASYCESHHIDEWAADQGRTDIDRGILLCRYHHMTLHNTGARITRQGRGDFMLHPPGGSPPIPLRPRLSRSYAWGVGPPARRFRPAV